MLQQVHGCRHHRGGQRGVGDSYTPRVLLVLTLAVAVITVVPPRAWSGPAALTAVGLAAGAVLISTDLRPIRGAPGSNNDLCELPVHCPVTDRFRRLGSRLPLSPHWPFVSVAWRVH